MTQYFGRFRQLIALNRQGANDLVAQMRYWLAAIEPVRLIFLQAGATLAVAFILLPVWRKAFAVFSGANPALKNSTRYFPWIRPYFFPDHKFTILAFIFTAVLAGVVVLVTTILLRRASVGEVRHKPLGNALLLSASLICCLVVAMVLGVFISPVEAGVVYIVAVLAAIMPLLPQLSMRLKFQHNVMLGGLIIAVIGQFIAICLFIAAGKMPIMADFLQIPTTTILKSSRSDPGRPVDTIGFINQNGVWGNQQIPDLRRWPQADAPCPSGNSFDLPHVPVLEEFVQTYRYQFYFAKPAGKLCFVGRLDEQELRYLSEIMPDYRAHLYEVAALNSKIWRRIDETPLSDEETQFDLLNRAFFIGFLHDLEQVFHHHLQFLNPIKEWRLGSALANINAPYGLSFIAVSAVMHLTGGLSHQSYLAAIFSIQLVYGLALIGLVFGLYRNLVSTFFMSAIVVGSLIGLGVTTLYTGTGYGPVRHAFDLGVIGFLALYLRQERPAFLVLAIAAGLANMLLDRFVGAFCPLALVAVLLLRGVAGYGRRPLLELATSLIMLGLMAGLFVYLGSVTAPNPYASQFFDGVWAFPVDTRSMLTYLGLVTVGIGVALWSIWKAPSGPKFIPLFLFAYTLLFLFYWLMVPNYGHLYKAYPVAALAVITLWHESLSGLVSEQTRRRTGRVALVIGLLAWFGMSRQFITSSLEAYQFFGSHAMYKWDFERVKATSPMDPQPFGEAEALIRKASNPQRPVYILSEFDSILLLLADRTSAMPHFETPTFLNSPRHLQQVIEKLRADKPERIIVDSCIACSAVPYRLTGTVAGVDRAYEARSVQKVDRLQRLKEIYYAIADDYEFDPGLSGSLVSVLQRKVR